MVANVDDDSKLWHFRLGHINYGSLRHTSHLHLAEGLPQINPPSGVCEGCVMGRYQLIHSDIFVKIPSPR
jgi:hypothetical protein